MPLDPQAQMVAVLAALSGLLLITYVIAFITPVATGRAERQTLARRINRALDRGAAPDAVARSELNALGRMEQVHLAHPVLHRFAGPDREASLAVAISRLLPGLDEGNAGYSEVRGLLRTLSAATIGPDDGSEEPMD